MKIYFFILITLIFSGCANIVAPSGGVKDSSPPELINSVEILNKESKQIEKVVLFFDENIIENQFEGNFYSSPPLEDLNYNVKSNAVELTFKSMSESNNWILLNNCIKDLNEGNILKSLDYQIINSSDDSLYSFQSELINTFTGEKEKNSWIMMYNYSIADSLIFKILPNYISKTNQNGIAKFKGNIKQGKYQIVSLSGDDYIYHEDELISFSDNLINIGVDTFSVLHSFNPLQKIDSSQSMQDSSITIGGSLTLKTDLNGVVIVQLLKEGKVILQKQFKNTSEFNLKNISTGEYSLRFFHDENKNAYWDTGNFTEKKQAERMYYYPEKITIRENWDLELIWITKE